MPDTIPTAREPQVMLGDLTGELLWPRTLRTPALAVRPARVLLGMGAVFIATLIGNLSTLWSDQPSFTRAIAQPIGDALHLAAQAVADLSPGAFYHAVASLALLPGRLLIERPIETLVLGLPMILVFVLLGGTISRAAAAEFAEARISDWPEDLRTAASKTGWGFAAIIAPLAMAGVLIGAIVLGGFTLGVPVLNLLAALLYAVAILLALIALALLLLQALSLPMLIPALMCEGTDAFDAVQRCYAYVLARPLRLLVHAALLLLLGLVSIGLFHTIAEGAESLAHWAAASKSSDAGVKVLEGGEDLTATQPAAHAVIRGWRALVDTAVAGFAFSYFFAAGTVFYLTARRICDGQGTGDIWNPDAPENDLTSPPAQA